MKWWTCGEYDVIRENLDDLQKKGVKYNPERKNIYLPLELIPLDKVKVVLLGQDPYPESKYATGLAFSIPEEEKVLPPTLTNIFKEYVNDLHYPMPTSGALRKWVEEGVLLWNVVPTCLAGKSLSHYEWPEWRYLTEELVGLVTKDRAVVIAALGSVAREFVKFASEGTPIIELSHPSPRASRKAKHPFFGSRLFSTINHKLCELGLEPVDWRLQ